jgi:hypothetical protein
MSMSRSQVPMTCRSVNITPLGVPVEPEL